MIGNLTDREVEVCVQIVKGMPPKEIAASLGIENCTARRHICNISYKLGRFEEDRHILPTIFVAVKLMQAAREFPLIAAALEL